MQLQLSARPPVRCAEKRSAAVKAEKGPKLSKLGGSHSRPVAGSRSDRKVRRSASQPIFSSAAGETAWPAVTRQYALSKHGSDIAGAADRDLESAVGGGNVGGTSNNGSGGGGGDNSRGKNTATAIAISAKPGPGSTNR